MALTNYRLLNFAVCEPITMGIAAAGTSALGAYGSYKSGVDAADATNRSRLRQAKFANQQYLLDATRADAQYGQNVFSYGMQLDENNAAASRAYFDNQRQYDELIQQASLSNTARSTALTQATGKNYAMGQAGKSADRANQMLGAAAGRDEAMVADRLLRARNELGIRNSRIRDDLRFSNMRAYSRVAQAPIRGVAPPAPVFDQGPSQLSLYAGLGNAAISGVNAGYEFDALKKGLKPNNPPGN